MRGASQDTTGPLTTRSTLRTFAIVSVISSAGYPPGLGDAGEGGLGIGMKDFSGVESPAP